MYVHVREDSLVSRVSLLAHITLASAQSGVQQLIDAGMLERDGTMISFRSEEGSDMSADDEGCDSSDDAGWLTAE